MATPPLLPEDRPNFFKRSSDNPLDNYIVNHSVKLTPEQQGLREVTEGLESSYMLSDSDQLSFLQNLITLIGGRQVLDIGVYTGYSSLSMALVLPDDGRVIACEISEQIVDIGRPFWKSAGVEHKIDVRLAPAVETLQKLIDEGHAGTFDFAYIDADKPNYDNYYEQCLVLLRSGGIMALDNMLWGGTVADPNYHSKKSELLRKLNDKIFNDTRVRSNLIFLGDGTVIVFKP